MRLAAVAVAGVMAAGATLAACSTRPPPPEEKWAVVTSEAAPLLGELEDDDPAQEVIRSGELVKIVREIRPFHWDAKMDGASAQREGMAVEVKYADLGAVLYGFKSDFAAEVSVPTTAYLCEAIAAQSKFDVARCPELLRRARLGDGALLVYMACSSGPCPVGVMRDGKLSAITVDSMTSALFFAGKKRSLLIAHARWTKDLGQQSGGTLVPIVLGGAAPEPGSAIVADRIDARDSTKMLARLVHTRVTAAEVVLRGDETVKSADGTTLSTKPVEERHALPALD